MSQSKINQAWQSINQWKKHHWCWAPTKAQFIFAWINSINSIIWNYKIKFMLILKHFKKIKENAKWCLSERKWLQIWLENGFLGPKKNLRMKNWRDEIIWKTRIWKNYLQTRFWKIIFKIRDEEMEEWHVAQMLYAKGGHAWNIFFWAHSGEVLFLPFLFSVQWA